MVRKAMGKACAVAVLASAALAGCYDDSEVTVHEPGEYKGPEDPLVERLATDTALRSELEERVARQTDR